MPQDKTANEEIWDGLTRHQVGIMRVSGHLRNSIISQLDSTSADLRNLITDRLEKIQARGADYGPETTRRLNELEKALAVLMLPTSTAINIELKLAMVSLARNEIQFLNQLIVTNLPVEVALVLPTAVQLRSIVFSRPMQGRVLNSWLSGWHSADRRRIMEQIRVGMVLGESNATIRRRVLGSASLGGADGVRNITRRGAEFLTRTVTNSVANNAREAMYRLNNDIIKRVVYTAILDARTSIICSGLSGQIFKEGKGPVPPLHGNCRSLRLPYIAGVDLGTQPVVRANRRELEGLSRRRRMQIINEKTGRVPFDQTYSQFLKRQPVEFVEDVLGKTKAKLFLQGNLPLSKFVDNKFRVLTIDQLRSMENAAFQRAGI